VSARHCGTKLGAMLTELTDPGAGGPMASIYRDPMGRLPTVTEIDSQTRRNRFRRGFALVKQREAMMDGRSDGSPHVCGRREKASTNPEKYGHRCYVDLKLPDSAETAYPINPRRYD